MAQKLIPWNTGGGNIIVNYSGSGNDTVTVGSDTDNPSFNPRSQDITVHTTAGASISRTVTVTQSGKVVPVGTIYNFAYTGTVQEVTLSAGTYKLQCWGAQGGTNSTDSTYGITAQAGGKGGYSEGILTLDEVTTLYIFVGGQGSSSGNGGWNGGGGGSGSSTYSTGTQGQSGYNYGTSRMGCGGGATDIALTTSTMSYSTYRTNRSSASYLSRFIVAGGGSGGAMSYEEKTTDTTTTTNNKSQVGYVGGGTNGGGYSYGTQTGSGSGGGFGYGANQTITNYRYASACGGGGWYGGGRDFNDSSNFAVSHSGGGSGFVNIAANAQYRPTGYTGLELNSGFTTAGSSSFEAVNGGTETGHSGNGYARITKVDGRLYEPLTFDILGSGTIGWKATNSSLTKTIEYKKNNGSWTSITSTTSGVTISVVSGDVVQFRGDNTAYGNNSYYNCFTATCNFSVRGNVMSLINSSDFVSLTNFTANYALRGLFYGNTYLQNAENLILPQNTYARCYQAMFRGCTSLTKGPDLPAAILATYAYYNLFYGCSSLTYIKCLATDISASNCTQTWVNGVGSGGTFVKKSSMSSWSTGTSGIPSSWTVQNV